mmetsp:Transcript_34852/g.78758  ORF Transcript_34852/g.78758 Transcript_34852/m.78758 type:complete len:214 (+) Transcript_34852:992-1633(+)
MQKQERHAFAEIFKSWDKDVSGELNQSEFFGMLLHPKNSEVAKRLVLAEVKREIYDSKHGICVRKLPPSGHDSAHGGLGRQAHSVIAHKSALRITVKEDTENASLQQTLEYLRGTFNQKWSPIGRLDSIKSIEEHYSEPTVMEIYCTAENGVASCLSFQAASEALRGAIKEIINEAREGKLKPPSDYLEPTGTHQHRSSFSLGLGRSSFFHLP